MLSELTIVMLTLFHEVGVCSDHEMRAVARVIQVRAEERHLTYKQVCRQPKQFSCWNGKQQIRNSLFEVKHRKTILYGGKVLSRCLGVALDMTSNQLKKMPRFNCYYNPALCHPAWADKMTSRAMIGHHVFGRLDE